MRCLSRGRAGESWHRSPEGASGEQLTWPQPAAGITQSLPPGRLESSSASERQGGLYWEAGTGFCIQSRTCRGQPGGQGSSGVVISFKGRAGSQGWAHAVPRGDPCMPSTPTPTGCCNIVHRKPCDSAGCCTIGTQASERAGNRCVWEVATRSACKRAGGWTRQPASLPAVTRRRRLQGVHARASVKPASSSASQLAAPGR